MSQTLLEVPPATHKQVQFLNTLLAEKNLSGTRYEGHTVAPAGLTVRDAADAITELVGVKSKANKEAHPGFYQFGETVYEVVKSKQGHTYAKQLIVKGKRGTWEFAPGALKNFQQWEPLGLDGVKQWGKQWGICMVCGRLLTNPESVAEGIGPICGGRMIA